LRFAARLANAGEAMIAIAQSAGANPWKKDLIADLRFLHTTLSPKLDCICPTLLDDWIKLWREHTEKWKQIVALFLQRVAAKPGRALALEAVNLELPVERKVQCDLCDMTFETPAALQVHKRHKHQHRARERDLVTGSVCAVCGNDYRTRFRAIQHLRSVYACKAAVDRGDVPRRPQVEIDAADAVEGSKQGARSRLKGPHAHALAGLPMIRNDPDPDVVVP
jgi:transposase-like protein